MDILFSCSGPPQNNGFAFFSMYVYNTFAVSPFPSLRRSPSLCRLIPARRSNRSRWNSGWLTSSQASPLVVAAASAAAPCPPALVDFKRGDGVLLTLRNPWQGMCTRRRTVFYYLGGTAHKTSFPAAEKLQKKRWSFRDHPPCRRNEKIDNLFL